MHSRRQAFTLLELIVAMAIGLGMLLMAATAFRGISSAIGRAVALGNQNDLLRIGVWQGFDDADWWHTASEAEAPYHKDWARLPRPDAGSTLRRPFAPLRFDADPRAAPSGITTLVNPAAFLPHETTAWSRIAARASQEVDTRSLAGNDSKGELYPGWNWRLLHGDHALVEATQMSDPDRYPALEPALNNLRGDRRPAMTRQLWQHLGFAGIAAYAHAGSSLVHHDELGRNGHPRGWPLLAGGSPMQNHNLMHTVRAGAGQAQSFLAAYTALGSADLVGMIDLRIPGKQGLGIRIPASEAVARRSVEAVGGTSRPFAALVMAAGDLGNHEGDFTRSAQDASVTVRVPAEVSDRHIDAEWLAQRFPAAPAAAWFEQNAWSGATMATESTRYLAYLGGTLSLHRVAIEDPGSGERIDLRFSVFGSSFRGIRQHLALVHRRRGGDVNSPVTVDGRTIEPAGDFYE